MYIGVTSDVLTRLDQHRSDAVEGFTREHRVHRLVHCEFFEEMIPAIEREKALKKWKRAWKIRLIEEANPNWDDLSIIF